MNFKTLWLTVVILAGLQSITYSQDHNILTFGAIPDGKTLNTVAIQTAIDAAHDTGGGRVIIPAGRFLSGSIILKSNVELYLNKNAVLLGSPNPKDYVKLNRWKALVMCDSQSNVSIGGKGVIDGQGGQLGLALDSLFYAGQIDSADYNFVEKRPKAPIRPQVLEFVNSRNIEVTGITIKNGACWVQTYEECKNLTLNKIRVISDSYWNNDGIDISNCANVKITNSYINSSDDGICLKSYKSESYRGVSDIYFCDSILISNCTVRSSASAIKFGTASRGGFKNVVIRDIRIFDTFRSAIALESIHGGVLENILVENIKARNTGNAIFIRLGKVNKLPASTLRNVRIQNLKVSVPFSPPDQAYEIRGPELPFFHNVFPSSIAGLPDHPVQNVVLENIKIVYPGRGNKAYANMPLHRLDDIPELPGKYPEFSMFGELPAWGFYVRHADGLTMNNIRIKAKKPDYRPAMVFDDVKKLKLESIDISGNRTKEPVFYKDVELIPKQK